ncbi:MAG: hypothetical protein HLUCCX10_08380 [Algoriphagus marincola HL-49]|uniref:Uncharacterized protein n=1 Tax=Algoriphagus marincola HL-49 TaxID=1305737 RepID=A0A0N8KG59_9BACT|nr:MAG: hypothetical protein HLUCCX10_08380 [Algoriphagus marincola HL-49]
MKRKVRRKPEPEEEIEEQAPVLEKEKEAEKMSPVEQERIQMTAEEAESPMNPLKS